VLRGKRDEGFLGGMFLNVRQRFRIRESWGCGLTVEM